MHEPAPIRPHRHVYDPDERERAYQTAGANPARSLREVAVLCGIPEGTVLRWSAEDGWQARRERDKREAAALMHRAALADQLRRAVLAQEIGERMLLDERTPAHVRAELVKYFGAQAGFVAASRVEVGDDGALPPELSEEQLNELAQTEEGQAELLRLQRARLSRRRN